ncbi:MAG: hypothetical protein LC107_01850 [Chitinophagales bacterium]|nr:hypothetical protein [Chitinophagales bacterium]
MMRSLFFILALFMGASLEAQNKEDIWKQLSKVTYKKEYDALMGFKVDKPVFGESVRLLENKEIVIRGYIIPTDGYKSHKEFVFSAYPFSMCFFCGGAGPETVMEVEAIEAIKYTVEPITIKGILKLNDKDINRLMFKLVQAQFVKS